MHKSPSVREAEACREWLEAELELVQPKLVVCLGATAVRSQLGKEISVLRDRGSLIADNKRLYLPTLHPAFVLRQKDKAMKQNYYDLLVCDLEKALAATKKGRIAHLQ